MMTSLSEVRTLTLTIYGTAFGDISGAIELANVTKMYPRTTHVNPKNHHFRTYVPEGMDPGRLSSGVKLSSVSCAS
jgi:poly(3-hydroxybutyrate) depolymerase